MGIDNSGSSSESVRLHRRWKTPILILLAPWLVAVILNFLLIGLLMALETVGIVTSDSSAWEAYWNKDYSTAARLFERNATKDPDLNDGYMWAASLYHCGRLAEVPRALNTPKGRELRACDWSVLGVTELADGRPAKALVCFQRAVQGHPDNALYHHNLAIALERTGDKRGAKREIDLAVTKGGPGWESVEDPIPVIEDVKPPDSE